VSKKAIIVVVIAVIVIGAGAYWLLRKDNTPSTSNSPTSSSSSNSSASAAATITYADSGFSPKSVTVKSGDTVEIKNTSARDMQFDSDPHPVHTGDPELNVGAVSPGQSMTFKVTTKGTHGYHNHLNPSDTGTIVVE
jgi:plastocyanin